MLQRAAGVTAKVRTKVRMQKQILEKKATCHGAVLLLIRAEIEVDAELASSLTQLDHWTTLHVPASLPAVLVIKQCGLTGESWHMIQAKQTGATNAMR